ncbi:hypothetical protein [Sphingopyxis indica]|uniref:Uncharacterized protein n=1 Tax=Sphingopyxis indica TaxID=436663 RepID=A0A239JKM6_9SPHN|nr:hypothetical protein [Sphingopyxis indica]WOF43694.1 hypothetical protein KNJ79_01625 [Sphingopyxis indica]SNT06122.1 hypothetical protein SAMN06295955_110120 [Sphingopyxis indica]
MLITSLLLVAMAQSPSADVATARVAFTKCLHADMKKSLEAKMAPADYETAIKTVCQTERDAFRKAVIALDKASGDSDADAAEDADMQVEDYHENFLEKFTDYTETNTMPAG